MESYFKLAAVILGVLTVQFLGNGPALSAAQADPSPTTISSTTTTTEATTTTTAAGATTPTTTTAAGSSTTTTAAGGSTTTTAAGATTTTSAPPSSCTCCTNCTTMADVTAAGQRWNSCQKYFTSGGPTTFTVVPDNQGQCMMSGTNCSQCCPQCLFCTQKNGAWLASCVSCPSSATAKPM